MSAPRTLDPERLDAFLGRFVLDAGAAMATPNIIVGDRLGLYRALADTMPADARAGRGKAGLRRALRARVAVRAGRGRLRRVRPRRRLVLHVPPSRRPASPTRAAPTFVAGAFEIAGSVYRTCDRLDRRRSSTATASAGTSTTPRSSAGTDRFFRPRATRPTCSPSGCPPSTGSIAKPRPARRSPTSAAGSGPRRSSWRGPSRSSASPASTTTHASIEAARATAARPASDGDVRGRARAPGFPGTRLRPGLHVRLPPRHGRPRRRRTHVRGAMADDGRGCS